MAETADDSQVALQEPTRVVKVRVWSSSLSSLPLGSASYPEAIIPTSFLKSVEPTQSIFTLIDKKEKKRVASLDKEAQINLQKQQAAAAKKRKSPEPSSDCPSAADASTTEANGAGAASEDGIIFDDFGHPRSGCLCPSNRSFSYEQSFIPLDGSSPSCDTDTDPLPDKVIKGDRTDTQESINALKSFWGSIDNLWYQSLSKRSRSLPELALLPPAGAGAGYYEKDRGGGQEKGPSADGGDVEKTVVPEDSSSSACSGRRAAATSVLLQDPHQNKARHLYARILSAVVVGSYKPDDEEKRESLVVAPTKEAENFLSSTSPNRYAQQKAADEANDNIHSSSSSTNKMFQPALLNVGQRSFLELADVGLVEEATSSCLSDGNRGDDEISSYLRKAINDQREHQTKMNTIVASLRRKLSDQEHSKNYAERTRRQLDTDKSIIQRWQKIRRRLKA